MVKQPKLMPWQALVALPFSILSIPCALMAAGGKARAPISLPLWVLAPVCALIAVLLLIVASDALKRRQYRWRGSVDTQWKLLMVAAFLFVTVLVL